MKKNRFSIIIPVYNCEKYISQSLESALSQKYSNYEIIVINDGSTDGTGKIITDMAKKERKITVLNTGNLGTSGARNLGMRKASGDYVIFLDADDFIDSNVIEIINANLKNDEMIVYGYKKEFMNRTCISMDYDRVIQKDNIEKEILLNNKIGGFICNKVFSMRIIRQYKLSFDEKIHYAEDLDFILKYVKYISTIRYLKISPYHYRMRKNSASSSKTNKKILTILDIYERLIAKYGGHKAISESLKYDFLVNYEKYKHIPEAKRYKDKVSNYRKEINHISSLSLPRYIKYNFIYRNRRIYKIMERLKNIKEMRYE